MEKNLPKPNMMIWRRENWSFWMKKSILPFRKEKNFA